MNSMDKLVSRILGRSEQMIARVINWVKSLFISRASYNLQEVFGCLEQPPQNCPTFLERKVHREFLNALSSYNIIVVYGESRQGKTWTIERYCSNQVRIGCTASMDIVQIKMDMLQAVNMEVCEVEHSITEEYSSGTNVYTNIGNQMLSQAGGGTSTAIAHKETITTKYPTVDIGNSEEFLKNLSKKSQGKYFVFDNFHYLSPQVQQQFCSLLKEFNYRGIKIIIVGVWKESSKITALAPDLVNRCAHIDIGSWTDDELQKVANLGLSALNITSDNECIGLFKRCCASNIGIFKDFLQKYCQDNDIYTTQAKPMHLNDYQTALNAAELVIREAYSPLHDRIKNLATPQRVRRESKNVRQKIIVAILSLIIKEDTSYTQSGLKAETIQAEIDNICRERGEALIQSSNVTQELGNLHLREENRQTNQNFIPLFYFDKRNRKILVIEPTIYVIKEYKPILLQNILNEIS